ncbi:putative membrane chloride channel (bestrophin family) [Amycolatopsis lexingtonensis]|uniref:Membrane chloride channel (Bestrophin family) n=1 Tax=Amycolatopsis lexingtonensis TaxID=218822 RepID=A0ABR9ICP2_9PSEU|nr:hypothetical protein [Amycolatopsis lexingtonensis]MBE1500931.1 putative membrane chloride channel (bestrophin family) [Amycolatopsis lexingtonensis]
MKRETGDLVRALAAVNKHMPRISTELLTEAMAAEKQREFAGLLVGLASLLIAHADEQEPNGPVTLADRVRTTGRELLRVAAQLEAEALSGPDLQEVARLLVALAEVLGLYAGKLPVPPATAGPPDLSESPGP